MTVQLLKVIAFTAILGTFAASAIVPASAKDAASRQVTQRMALMASQKAALDVLTEMMAGRSRFDRSKARNARRQLVRSTGSIARHFRKARMAPRTRARVLIWQNWTDFKERAQTANTAARSLGTRSLPALRQTLPGLMQSCLSCHEAYRDAPNSFITH